MGAIVAAAAIVIAGCGGGGGVTTVPAAGTPATPAPSAKVATQTGSVQLPRGSTVSLSSLTVQNSLGTSAVSSAGTFKVPAFTAGAQYAYVTDANGNPMFMGFLGPQEPVLNAQTTAEVLVYLALAVYLYPDSVKSSVYASIASTPGFSSVQSAVASAVAGSPVAFASTSTAGQSSVTAALQGFLFSLTTPSAQSLPLSKYVQGSAAGSRPASERRGIQDILVDPSAGQSGLTVLNTSPVQVSFQQTYLRRAAAFFDQVSYGNNSGGNTVITPAPITDVLPEIEIPAVTALKGLKSTVVNIANGNYAGAQFQTNPVTLQPVGSSYWTRYQITTVGAGANPGAYDLLTSEQVQAQGQEVMATAVLDEFVPLMASLVLPYSQLDSITGIPLAGNIAKDALNGVATLAPQVIAAVQSGDINKAITVLGTFFHSSSTYQKVILNTLVEAAQITDAAVQAQWAANFAKAVSAWLNLADAALTVANEAALRYQILNSDQADIFTVTAVQTNVILTPATATVANGQSVVPSYSVNVPSAGGSNLKLTYTWNNTAHYGHFCDLAQAPACDSFSSTTQNQGVYTANQSGQGTDTITVTVGAIDSSGNKIERYTLGSASATVAVESPSPTPAPLLGTPPSEPESRCAPLTVSPHVVTLGQTITGTVADQGPLACGGDIPGGTRPTWTWTGSGLQTVTSGCTMNSDSCVLTARATTTGSYPSTGGYASLCLNGNSTQGPWTSCDYYAVIPQ